MPRDVLMDKREWLLKRHSSLSPRQLALAYGVGCAMSFAVAAGFLLLGVWQVLPFTVLEMAAVAAAFIHYARHAGDCSRIELSAAGLLVETICAGRVSRVRLDPFWTRVTPPNRPRQPIALEARGVRVAVGALALESQKQQCALELQRALPGARFP
ncbi:DUF2244 domain-containing protein [Rugamonas sp. CCM 8940]|uniref:DUF2244 domain-containing protein n=1 Tax=Rugamonas sp. CCM 8940 TaxID=2765359 RepID=UPI0018F410BD|nr:DUF2244 domain-containing protein [Rugamonas sp. CCM 8940]MBJ7309738.1 DUF2244 domain-containing protein [Rugamonas sp. CCM 8940]